MLVVDDNNDIADTLKLMLQALGHESRSCNSCYECLCCLEDFRPDIVLLDLCLPECDGFEIYRQIRQHEAYRCLPVIACSALDPELCEHEKPQNCDFAAYLVKPVTLLCLQAALAQAAVAITRRRTEMVPAPIA